MSLNNLRNYNWEQGTLSNPVSITGTQFSWLINLLKKSTVNKDIRGYIQVGSPITSYEKYLVELAKDEHNQPLLHLVNPTVTPVEYTVVPQVSTIKEGTSTKLNINGIGLEALKFRIVNHTNDTPDYQARTTIDAELGYVRVAPAQENTTWTDVVTIQTCPVWEEWSDQGASIVEFDVTVNATAVTSVTITAPQYVKPGVTFNPIVNFLPVGHTKPIVNTLEDASAKKGICFIPASDDFTVGKTTDPTKMSAIAPNTETPVGETWSLGCGVYAFTNTQTIATPSVNVAVKYPYIQFTVTTDGKFSDISSANPKITLQKVDSEDTPIGEPVVLTGQPTPPLPSEPTSLVYTYGKGNVAGDGSETYKVTFGDAPEGYKNIQQMTITPNQVITEISVQYVVKRPDIYQVYADGDYEPIYAVEERGSLKAKVPAAIAFVTEETSFMIKSSNMGESQDYNNKSACGGSSQIPETYNGRTRTITQLVNVALMDFNGEVNTKVIVDYILDNPNDFNSDCWFVYAYNRTITINNVTYNGYVPASGQNKIYIDNANLIAAYSKKYYGSSGEIKYSKPNIIESTGVTTSTLYDNGKSSSKNNHNAENPAYVVYPFNL